MTLVPLTELLQNPIWQLVLGAATIFAVPFSLATYFARRVHRNLSFDVVHNEQILTIDEENIGNLQLMFAGKSIHNPRLLVVCITNVGNQPITPEDFFRSLTFSLNTEAIVLSSVIVESQPSDLTAELSFKKNTVKLEPLLLNPKDSFTVKLLVSGYKSGPNVDARIKGISKVQVSRNSDWDELIILLMALAFMLCAIWLLPARPDRPPFLERLPNQIPGTLFAAMGFVSMIVGSVNLAKKIIKKQKLRRT